MIRSMTGFGEARLEQDGQSYHLELRSVNNRYLKTSIHLPEQFSGLDSEMERQLREKLMRGSVSARLYVRNVNAEAAVQVDASVLRAYVEALRGAAGSMPQTTINLATLLSLPGVVTPREMTEEERESRWELLSRLTQEALDRLIAMRTTEGQALATDLGQHCDRIRASLDVIRAQCPAVVREYRDRLMARVQELIADTSIRLAEEDVLKEVSIYAERSDIAEEISRLEGHLGQFGVHMKAPEPSGRKLEFIAQEMLREANTIGSKTGDATIAREIIEVKRAIDRIKEQVQNAE